MYLCEAFQFNVTKTSSTQLPKHEISQGEDGGKEWRGEEAREESREGEVGGERPGEGTYTCI